MNLGQAVAICCYELVRERPQLVIEPLPSETAAAGTIEVALRLLLDVLRSIDYVIPGNEPDLTRRLRSKLLGLNLTNADVEMLCGVLKRIK